MGVTAETLENRTPRSVRSDSADELLSLIEESPIVRLPIRSLQLSNYARREENVEHARMMAALDVDLPPIVVHRPTMRVIDGVHRVRAYLMRGREHIDARFFDGSLADAFLIAVKANVTHGLPLSLADREAAAARIVVTHQDWSDRAIAEVTGLSPKTVAAIRRKANVVPDGPQTRIGRDGRVRPLDATAGRIRASQYIRARPWASVREIARQAGVSIGTAHDVRERMAQGLSPVPGDRRGRNGDGSASPPTPRPDPVPSPPAADRFRALMRDPSLRYNERGRALLRWLQRHLLDADEWRDMLSGVPDHCAPAVAMLARAYASEWHQIADTLQLRTR